MMAQVTIYMQEKLLLQARKQAEQANKSLSAYVSGLVARESSTSEWPEDLVSLLRQGGADLVEPDDPAAEDIDPFE